MCQKIPYETKADAIKDAKIIRANKAVKQRRKKKDLNAYYCRICDRWHLTSQRQIKKKKLLSS